MITIIPTKDDTREKVWIFGDSFGDPCFSHIPYTYTYQLNHQYQVRNYCLSGSSPIRMLNELFKKIIKHKRKLEQLKDINLIFLLSYAHRFDFKPFEASEASNFAHMFYRTREESIIEIKDAEKYLPWYKWAKIYARHHRIPYNVDEIDEIRNLQTLIAQGKLFKKVLVIQVPQLPLNESSSYTDMFLKANNKHIFDNVSVNQGPGLETYMNMPYTDSLFVTHEINLSPNHLSETNHHLFYNALSLWINKTEASSFSTTVLKQEIFPLDFR